MIIRLVSLLALLAISISTPWWLFVVGLILYAFIYSGFELLILAAMIDAYFLYPGNAIPLYTIASVGFLALAILIRPYVALYNQPD